MKFAEKIEGGNYTHEDVTAMFRWLALAKANEKMLKMDRENAEKREYEVIGRANDLEVQLTNALNLLREIGDFTNDRITGQAVPDTPWEILNTLLEIRAKAYKL